MPIQLPSANQRRYGSAISQLITHNSQFITHNSQLLTLNSHLTTLLTYLSTGTTPASSHEWQGWQIEPVRGGANNRLFRASGPPGDLAIKVLIRDTRDRAGREFGALQLLAQAGLQIAPEALLLDREHYPQPVVVQRWLAGVVSDTPPTDDAEWQALLGHYATIHTVRQASSSLVLAPALINAASPQSCHNLVQQQLGLLPAAALPIELGELTQAYLALRLPAWDAVPLALCRVDANTSNFIRRPGEWASVDWENSGWGDPAFEIADIITHPKYADVPAERWPWVIEHYCQLVGDAGAAVRIRAYELTMLVWWAVRYARTLYEVPRGLDPRLVQRADDWQAQAEAGYWRYVGLAQIAASGVRGNIFQIATKTRRYEDKKGF